MSWRIAAPLCTIAAAFLLALLERRFPYDRGQRFFREGFWTDLLLYALLQSYVCALVIAAFVEWLDARTGLSHLGLVSSWPVAAQVLFFVITHDLYIYGFHRWQHSSPRLWRLHEAHHSASHIDWLAGARSHTFEILINQTIEFAPMILLGAAPVAPLIKGMISGVWGMYIHSNLDVRTGRLQFLINGPEAHRWHHSTDLHPPGMNFATKLAIWDILFGTFWLPRDAKPTGYGLTYVDFPKGYLRQHLFAFRSLNQTAGTEEGERPRTAARS
jgi:sterol desaturase/sphingolipid hydroxylase (fatty acid hydroxylase superfamily)